MNRDEINKELESLDSTLTNKTPLEQYDIPDGYFDQFRDNIISEVFIQKEEYAKQFSLLTYVKYAAAAAVILLIGVYTFAESEEEPIMNSNMDFVLENMHDVDEEMLFDFDDMEEINEFSSAEIPEESIIEFLDLYINEIDEEYLAILE